MAQIGTYRLETAGGTVDVPVFDTGDSGSNVEEMWRVQTGTNIGFIPLTDPSNAAHPYLRMNTQNHGVLAVHDLATVSTIQYFATNVSGGDSTWPDDQNNADMSLTNKETDSTLSDGSEALAFDGSSDHGTTTMPAELEGSSLNAFSVEFAFQSTSGGPDRITGVRNSGDSQRFEITLNVNGDFNNDDGNINVIFEDTNGNQMQFGAETNPNLDDGNRHDVSVIIDDASTSSATMIIDGTDTTLSFSSTGNPSSLSTWDTDMATAAANNGGSIFGHWNGSIGAIRWHAEALASQTISEY